jgi:sialidase-1
MMRLYARRRRTARVAAIVITGAVVASSLPLVASTGAGEGLPSAHAAGSRTTTVFQRGEGGYHTFRIPAVVKATEGTLLAFAEARVIDPGDDGDIDLVLKRSADSGASWGPLQVVADDGPNKFGNPVPIVDRRTGRIVLNTTRTGGDVTGEDVRCGRADAEDTRRSFIQYSDDNGATWSVPAEITQDVKPSTWRHFVGGPGHGVQLESGEHAGRLVIPGNHSAAPSDGSDDDCGPLAGGHSLYSDDGGATWQLGAVDTPTDGVANPNESTAVELDDGRLYFSARDQGGTSPGRRLGTTSSDGGASFDARYTAVPDVVTSQVQGSVIKLTQPDRSSRVVLSVPGHSTARENLTLWSSVDQTTSWRRGPVVYEGPSGYSDLVQLDTTTLGVLFENGDRLSDEPYLSYHQRITFARVPVATLDTPAPPPLTTPDDSSNGHDASVSGRPRPVRGVFGSALELAGDHVEAPHTEALAFGEGSFTAAAWFRTSGQAQQAILWAHSTAAGEPKWWIRLEPDLGRLRASVETAAASRSVSAPGQFADGEWHHVALTRDQSGLRLYVDGSLAATAAAVSGSVSADARTGVRVGARVDGISNPLRGTADEVWLLDRSLTAAEVKALAQGNVAPDGSVRLHLPLNQVGR